MRFPLWRRRRLDEELEEEIQAHLEMAKRDRMERGETADEAQESARREFGNVGLVKEVTREMWGWRWLEQLGQDLHYGARMLIKSHGFTLISIITLALGIGANTAIFSVVDAVLLRPLHFIEPDRLVRLFYENHGANSYRLTLSRPNFEDCKNQSRLIENLAAYGDRSQNLTGSGDPERISLAAVSANFFKVLKVEPVLGRGFLPEEDEPGAPRVVVLSYGFWQRRFGADPQIVGKTITLDGYSYTIIGVMPREAQWPRDSQLWRLLSVEAAYARMYRGNNFLKVIGRLKPGASLQQAQTEMDAISGVLARQYPETNTGWSMGVVPLMEDLVGRSRPTLLMLLGAAGFILLIACANVAGLLLARGASREKEIAIRTAVGAGRWRLARQLLTESMLLAIAGGVLGLLFAIWTPRALVALNPGIPRVEEIGVDHRVLGFTLAISLGAGLVFGLFPALQISSANLNESLKEGGRGAVGFSRYRLRSLLVISELALSLILLGGAMLMIKGLGRLVAEDPGFEPDGVLNVPLLLNSPRYSRAADQAAFSERLIRELSALPEVKSVGITANRPFSGVYNFFSFDIEGRPPLPVGQRMTAERNSATPDYFRTMRIPLLKGRVFTEQDTEQSPAVVVISETMARLFWPGEDPLGQRISISDDGPNPRQIVGVVGDVKQEGLGAGRILPMMYLSFMQSPRGYMNLMARSSGDVSTLTAAVRSRIHELDRDIPVDGAITMSQLVFDSLARRIFSTLLLMIFAGLALVLAMVGVYGVVSYAVQQRRREIGLRIALGAQSSDVLRMVVGQGMRLAAAGVAIGTPSAIAMAILMTSFSDMPFDVTPTDWPIFVLIPLLLLAVAFMPCLILARRATKIDPLVALRCE
jgi:putative ABC transport system permease protein